LAIVTFIVASIASPWWRLKTPPMTRNAFIRPWPFYFFRTLAVSILCKFTDPVDRRLSLMMMESFAHAPELMASQFLKDSLKSRRSSESSDHTPESIRQPWTHWWRESLTTRLSQPWKWVWSPTTAVRALDIDCLIVFASRGVRRSCRTEFRPFPS
jgi:hypothetical protein